MAMGRSTGDGKTDVMEEGVIGNESAKGLVSISGQKETCNGRGGVAKGTGEVSEMG